MVHSQPSAPAVRSRRQEGLIAAQEEETAPLQLHSRRYQADSTLRRHGRGLGTLQYSRENEAAAEPPSVSHLDAYDVALLQGERRPVQDWAGCVQVVRRPVGADGPRERRFQSTDWQFGEGEAVPAHLA